jgi:Fe-S-cluster-containing dehydrogenase component
VLVGLPYGAREYDYGDGVMKKCTLCVDRIYNEELAEEDRVPACVRACPTGARHFGDLGDADSAVSSWWPSAAASICCRSSATSRSTSTCRRARAATPRRSKASRAAHGDAAPGSAA